MAKAWDGRFSKGINELANKFNSSIKVDSRMFFEDINGSIAHVTMLGEIGVLSNSEVRLIVKGLQEICNDIASEKLSIDFEAEDIHMFIESKLIEKIGDVGKKMHTARSRNDQIRLDSKMYLIKEIKQIKLLLIKNIKALLEISKNNTDTIMPGYTHLQRAQPISLAHYCLAYVEMFTRDLKRLDNTKALMNEMPLGVAALAGTSYRLNRNIVADLLGFKCVTKNSLDTVSDRDYMLELASNISLIMMHLSRLSEEIILFASSEFNFVELDDSFATGSSIMPQKKNPDMFELIRGKSAKCYGNMMSLFVLMKGLPLAYNKDMQEDKELIFSCVDTVKDCLAVLPDMLLTIKFIKDNMLKACKSGYMCATEIADYLVSKGISFRDAHKITGKIVAYAIAQNLNLEDISISKYKEFSDKFSNDIYTKIDIKNTMNSKTSFGGTAEKVVKIAIANKEKEINKYEKI